jgi:hypothetical protein
MAGNPIIEAVTPLLKIFEEVGIRYYAGGSVASSVHGIPRYTQDVDLVAELRPDQIEEIAARAAPAFYVDTGQMRDALRYGRSFNVIHFGTSFKIDVFPLQNDSFHLGELVRSEKRTWAVDGENGLSIQVASAEDTILEKLAWYKRGGETSDRQWSDVLGIATTRSLHWNWLREWAPKLGVADLLERLHAEASQIHLE